VPELTRRMVEKIFATNFEDWPALLRALRETGDDFKHGKVAIAPLDPNTPVEAATDADRSVQKPYNIPGSR